MRAILLVGIGAIAGALVAAGAAFILLFQVREAQPGSEVRKVLPEADTDATRPSASAETQRRMVLLENKIDALTSAVLKASAPAQVEPVAEKCARAPQGAEVATEPPPSAEAHRLQQQASQLVQSALASGRMSAHANQELKAILPLLPPSQRRELVLEIVRATNEGKLLSEVPL